MWWIACLCCGCFYFRYDLMLSCWNEDPEKRLTFSQLYRALKQLDGEIEVNCTQKLSDFCWSFPAQLTKTICAVVSPHPSFNTFSLDYSNTIYTRPDGFHVLCCLVPLFKIWFMKNNSFTIPGLYQPDDIQWKSVRERLIPLR